MARVGVICLLAFLVLANTFIVEADPLPQFGRRILGSPHRLGSRGGGISISSSKSISITRGGGGGAGSFAQSSAGGAAFGK